MTASASASLRGRLSGLLVVVALAWGLAVSAVVWLAVRHEVEELLDDTLAASSEVLAQLLGEGGPAAAPPVLPAADRSPAVVPADVRNGEARFAWQLVGAGGALLQRSAHAPAEPWLQGARLGFADAGDHWRVYSRALPQRDAVLLVAQTRAERREAQAEVAVTSVWAALVIALGSAWWLRRRVKKELEPLADLPAVLARYEPLARGAHLAAAARAELQPVHDAIENLGARLAQRVANERAFSAHAAHALRTPLAGIDAQLAVALRECPPEQRERLERVRQAAGRLTRVVTALLALFRSGGEVDWREVDLAACLDRLPFEGLALQLNAGGTLRADPDLLTAALLNLLDNARSHGARRVRVTLAREGGGSTVTLHDDGRGADEGRRRALSSALERQAYEGAMGLGLMLGDLIARAHGGRLELPAADSGFVVRLHFGPGPEAPR